MKKGLEKISNYYLIFCIYALIGWLYEVTWMWFVVPPKHFVNRGVLFGPFLPIYGFGMLILLLFLSKFMKNKHKLGNFAYLIISITTIITFIYTTLIEYTTSKIYNLGYYISHYGIGLFISIIFATSIVYFLTKKVKKIKEFDITIVLVFLAIWIITTVIEYISHFVMDKAFHIILWNYSKDFLNINARVNWDASRNFAIGGTLLLYIVQPLVKKFLKKLEDRKKVYLALLIGTPMIIDFIFHVLLKII